MRFGFLRLRPPSVLIGVLVTVIMSAALPIDSMGEMRVISSDGVHVRCVEGVDVLSVSDPATDDCDVRQWIAAPPLSQVYRLGDGYEVGDALLPADETFMSGLLDPTWRLASNGVPEEGDLPMEVAFTADGSKIVVAHRWSQNLTIFDAETRDVLQTVPLSGSPNSVALSADGLFAVTANIFEDNASILRPQAMSSMQRLDHL